MSDNLSDGWLNRQKSAKLSSRERKVEFEDNQGVRMSAVTVPESQASVQ